MTHDATTYRHGCRCPACREAEKLRRRRYPRRQPLPAHRPGDAAMCAVCGDWFRPSNLVIHERHIHQETA
jgi:hypothetical protein